MCIRDRVSTPLADWKAYMRWHVVHARAAYLSAAFVQANFDFFGKYLRGTPEQRPRWKRCVCLLYTSRCV